MTRSLFWALMGSTLLSLQGCSTSPKDTADQRALEDRAAAVVRRLLATDPPVKEKFFDTAKGYAVFPTVAKGAIGIGGAWGRGVLYEGGKVTGYCSVTQATIGLQLGGQGFSEVIFFEDQNTLQSFKSGTLEFAAQASAVAASAGATAAANYEHGVAVFVLGEKGLMYEASIGGQKFDFEPIPVGGEQVP